MRWMDKTSSCRGTSNSIDQPWYNCVNSNTCSAYSIAKAQKNQLPADFDVITWALPIALICADNPPRFTILPQLFFSFLGLLPYKYEIMYLD